MQSRKRTRLRPAEGWPKDWYYSGEFDTVNIEALLAPDEFFNRVILEREEERMKFSDEELIQILELCDIGLRTYGDHPQSEEITAIRDRVNRVLNRRIPELLGRELKPRPEAEEARQPDSTSAPRREPKA